MMKVGNSMEIDSFISEKLQKIIENIRPYECQVVGALWKDPELYFEYFDVVKKIIKSYVWKFYLYLGDGLLKNNYKKFDNTTVETFLNNHPKKTDYEKYGGYKLIENVMKNIDVSNIQSNIEILKKYAIIFDYITTMTITNDRLEKLFQQNSFDDVVSFFDLKTEEILNKFVNESVSKVVSKIDDGLEEMIKKADKGENIGLPLNSKILNSEIGGLRLGECILFGGLTGTGKSTITQEIYLSSIWQHQESCVIFLNEQDVSKWQQQFLTWIINNILLKDETYKFNSRRWLQGHFTEKEKSLMNKAVKLLKSKVDSNLIIIEELNVYTSDEVIRSIKKYAKLGIKYFVLDTFKVSSNFNMQQGSVWFAMQEDIRKFCDLIKPSNLNVNLWITLQLEKGAVNSRYLTGHNIGMAKNITDTANVVLLMRNMHDDEYANGKRKLKVIEPVNLDKIKNGVEKVLDNPSQAHSIIFLEKNRNGTSKQFQIVAEQNLGTLEWKEIGITSVPFGE